MTEILKPLLERTGNNGKRSQLSIKHYFGLHDIIMPVLKNFNIKPALPGNPIASEGKLPGNKRNMKSFPYQGRLEYVIEHGLFHGDFENFEYFVEHLPGKEFIFL